MDEQMSVTEYATLLHSAFTAQYGDIDEKVHKLIMQHDRDILEAAADRHCRKTCDERGYRDGEYHCRICPDRRAILEPITKEKS